MSDTRTQILQKLKKAIHLDGFRGMRPEKVLAEMGISKGAFYYYFPDKYAAGYAVVEELLQPVYLADWHNLALQGTPILDAIANTLQRMKEYVQPETAQLGCPLNNLIQEMCPLDEGFRKRLHHIVEQEVQLITHGLQNGQQLGQVNQNVVARNEAVFILASLEGSYTMAKAFNSKTTFDTAIDVLIRHVHSLST